MYSVSNCVFCYFLIFAGSSIERMKSRACEIIRIFFVLKLPIFVVESFHYPDYVR